MRKFLAFGKRSNFGKGEERGTEEGQRGLMCMSVCKCVCCVSVCVRCGGVR